MDLTQLRTFVAVAQEGHLTRAAERLHISQPAASSHIRALELYLRVQLFARTNRGLELTQAGRRLAESAERVLGASVELESLARELRGGVGGRLHLGTNADPFLSRIGALTSWLRQRHPLLDLNVEMRSSLATRQGVRAGELDAGFLLGSDFEKGLTGLVVKSLDYRIAGPHAWAEQIRTADWKALARLPWIVTAPGTSNHEMREQLFRSHGLEVNASIETNNDLMLRALIAGGVGVGLVREDFAEEGERNGIFALSPLGKGQTNLLFVYPDARHGDPIIQAAIEGVCASWPEAGNKSSSFVDRGGDVG
jgi:DNA-binding transcriptional LysR family regulator